VTPRRLRSALRFGSGRVLAATGLGKLLDVPGFARVLGTYHALPEAALLPAAAVITSSELLLAAWLFSGRGLAAAAVASTAMHLAYAAWSASALARGLELPNCGCFGVFLARPLTPLTIAEDVGMTALSATLWRLAVPRTAPA
jgi:hypothetical protein